MIEKDIYSALKRAFPSWDWTRIETFTESGVPDVNYCTPEGIEGWIELKIGVPRLKPSQVAWHTRAIAYHRRAFVLTFHNSYTLYRTHKFSRVDTSHFTPSDSLGCLVKASALTDLSNCLTSTY